jgi:hypothetical protein
MATVDDFGNEFVRRAREGGKPVARVKKKHAESFFNVLAREGIEFARSCLDEIKDPELRRIIEAIFFSAAAGAALGLTIGGMAAGPAGAKVGALVGASIGVAAAVVAIVVQAVQEGPDNDPELVVSLAPER